MYFCIMAKRFKMSCSIRLRADRFKIADLSLSERNRNPASLFDQMRQHLLLKPAADRYPDRISFHRKLQFRIILLQGSAYGKQLIQIRSGRNFQRIGNRGLHRFLPLIRFKSIAGSCFRRFRPHDGHDHAGGSLLHLHGFLPIHNPDLICFLFLAQAVSDIQIPAGNLHMNKPVPVFISGNPVDSGSERVRIDWCTKIEINLIEKIGDAFLLQRTAEQDRRNRTSRYRIADHLIRDFFACTVCFQHLIAAGSQLL